jgi:hypothetical protein
MNGYALLDNRQKFLPSDVTFMANSPLTTVSAPKKKKLNYILYDFS